MGRRTVVYGLLVGCMLFGATNVDARPATKQRKAKAIYNCSKKVHEAIERFQRRRYGEVQAALADAKFQCGGHEAMDTIIFYLAKSLMMLKRAEEAKTEFSQLLRDMPNSPFAEEARFRLGHSSFIGSPTYDRDQSGTREAVREFSEFLELYPDGVWADSARVYIRECREKLAKKEFMNARYYEKIGEYESAIVYYKVFLEEYGDSKLVPEVKLSMVENLLKVNRISEAREVVDDVMNGQYDQEIKEKARTIFMRGGRKK